MKHVGYIIIDSSASENEQNVVVESSFSSSALSEFGARVFPLQTSNYSLRTKCIYSNGTFHLWNNSRARAGARPATVSVSLRVNPDVIHCKQTHLCRRTRAAENKTAQ